MPNPTEQELHDLTRRLFAARNAEARQETDLARARKQAADSRKLASTKREATSALLDEYRGAPPSGEALPVFLARVQDARKEEQSAEAGERESRLAYLAVRKVARRAHAKIAALADSLIDYPLFPFLNDPAEAAAAPEARPALGPPATGPGLTTAFPLTRPYNAPVTEDPSAPAGLADRAPLFTWTERDGGAVEVVITPHLPDAACAASPRSPWRPRRPSSP